MDESPSIVGARAEREVAYALGSAGYEVYLPAFAPHARVDLVAIRRDEILRVQVKTASARTGVVFFRTCSNTANEPRSYRDEVDAFGVYSPSLGQCFLVPAEGLGERGCQLRLQPAANGQTKGIRLADDYRLTPPR